MFFSKKVNEVMKAGVGGAIKKIRKGFENNGNEFFKNKLQNGSIELQEDYCSSGIDSFSYDIEIFITEKIKKVNKGDNKECLKEIIKIAKELAEKISLKIDRYSKSVDDELKTSPQIKKYFKEKFREALKELGNSKSIEQIDSQNSLSL